VEYSTKALFIVSIYGIVGLIVMEALKWGKGKLFSE